MRRSLLLLGVLLSDAFAAAFADGHPPSARYLVATRKPAQQVRLRFDRDIEIRRFVSVNGFAAELTAEEVAKLRKSPEVLFIEEDFERYAIGFVNDTPAPWPVRNSRGSCAPTTECIASAATTQQTPYGITMVAAPRIWDLGRGRSVRVGVIDTGIEKNHPDLIDDYKGGFDFVKNDEDPEDESGHGTHVAGTIAALDNDFGVVGVAPDVEIYSLKVLGGIEGSGSVSNVIRAIDWAIEHKMHVINLSLGSDEPSVMEEQALQRAADAGVLAVAAAGNGYTGTDGLSYPGAYNIVVSVGAVDSRQAIADFSQRGSGLKLVAPGVSILSATPVVVDITAGNNVYEADLLEGSPRGSVTGEFVFCGLGKVGQFPESVNGKIALIQRGEITFREKATNAKNVGAVAVIIYNNVPGLFSGTLIRDSNGEVIPEALSFAWPLTVGISQQSGEALRSLGGAAIAVSARPGGYGELNGTSMASPHVTGVAALLWSIVPNATVQQVRQAILDGTIDLGAPGFDTTFGFGLVNAYNAARRLAPEKFPTPPRTRGARR